MPFFSIIIPTFNRRQSLEKAINSVLSQTFIDFEVLVMDDGSHDGTDSFIHSIADSRVFYEWKENTGGPANPRNRGIKKSRGEWICFLDADDYWTSNKLESCFNAIEKDIDFIYHDLLLVNERKNFFFFTTDKIKGREMSSPIVEDLLLNGNDISTSSVLIRSSILAQTAGFDERKELVAAEDFELWLKVAIISNNFFYINQCLGYYLNSGNGISEKNMSNTYYSAIVNYLHLLNESGQKRAVTYSKYMNSKYLVINKKQFDQKCIFDLFFCIRYAKFEIRLKSIFIISLVIINALKDQITTIFEKSGK